MISLFFFIEFGDPVAGQADRPRQRLRMLQADKPYDFELSRRACIFLTAVCGYSS